jgi:tripartite-type tricarboxylate transporter receptor subunit TctC
MKLPRRKFLHLAAGVAALPAVPRVAWAQAYPTRPVRIVAGFPAGGTTDCTKSTPAIIILNSSP